MIRHGATWRFVPTLVVALTLVACGTGPGPSASSAPASGGGSTSDPPPNGADRTPSAECVNPPVDLLTLINQTDSAACYGDADLTIEAEPVVIGAIDCAGVEPAWFGCGAWVRLQPVVVGRQGSGFVLAATTGPPGLPWMFATIHPETALSSIDIVGERLRITGHYDDPAAQTCVETVAPFGEPSDPEFVIASCRNLFVMTAFERI